MEALPGAQNDEAPGASGFGGLAVPGGVTTCITLNQWS